MGYIYIYLFNVKKKNYTLEFLRIYNLKDNLYYTKKIWENRSLSQLAMPFFVQPLIIHICPP